MNVEFWRKKREGDSVSATVLLVIVDAVNCCTYHLKTDS